MKTKLLVLLLGFFLCLNGFAEEKEKKYRVELVLFQKNSRPSEAFIDRGEPDLTEAVPFVSLPPNKLVLQNAKQKLSQYFTPILHDGWLQSVGTKTEPMKVRLIGGKQFDDGHYQVKGTFKILPGRQLFIDTDLAIKNGDDTVRFESIAPITQDELNYITYANYIMVVLIGPAVTPRI